MQSRSLRELQQKGEKIITSNEALLLSNRSGPIGILVPVSVDNLMYIQKDIEQALALQSLRETWKLARNLNLDQLSDDSIAQEVKNYRKKKKASAIPKHRY